MSDDGERAPKTWTMEERELLELLQIAEERGWMVAIYILVLATDSDSTVADAIEEWSSL